MQDKKKGGGLMKIVDALGKAEKKRAVAQTIVAATGLGLASVIGMLTLYDSFFPRYERPDYEVTPGVRCYQTDFTCVAAYRYRYRRNRQCGSRRQLPE